MGQVEIHKCSLLWKKTHVFQAFGTQQNAEVKTISEHNTCRLKELAFLHAKVKRSTRKGEQIVGYLQEQDGILASYSR